MKIETRKELVNMINDIIDTTKKSMWIDISLNDLIGNAKSVEEATKNSLFKLAEVMTLEFGVNSESAMKELFYKYIENLHIIQLYTETKLMHKKLFPISLPETKTEMIIKINILKEYCANYYVLTNSNVRVVGFVSPSIVRKQIKEIEEKL